MEKTKNEFSLIQNLYVDAMINNLPRKWKHILKISHSNYRNLVTLSSFRLNLGFTETLLARNILRMHLVCHN